MQTASAGWNLVEYKRLEWPAKVHTHLATTCCLHPTPAIGCCCASYPAATHEQPSPPHTLPSKALAMPMLTSHTHPHPALDRLRAVPLSPPPYLGEALQGSFSLPTTACKQFLHRSSFDLRCQGCSMGNSRSLPPIWLQTSRASRIFRLAGISGIPVPQKIPIF